MSWPALIVTPHSSGHIPADILAEMLGQQLYHSPLRQARLEWMFREGDPYTDVLFHTPQAHNLHASISRFVVDLNRHHDEGGNNGVIKLSDFEEQPLYPPGFVLSTEAREERLRRYWDSFHREIERVIETQNIRLLVNGHSMQPKGPLIGPDAGQPRPALCLMTAGDSEGNPVAGHGSLPAGLAKAVHQSLVKHFASLVKGQGEIALNSPWQTDQLTHRYSDPLRKKAVPGFGLEFNRALYLTYQEGKEYPNDPMIKALNQAFQGFLQDVMELL
jgi:N-formylglutamate amidohydrolase